MLPKVPRGIPTKIPELSAWLNITLRASITRVNKKGKSGSPCLIPLWYLRWPWGESLIKIEAFEEPKRLSIQLTHRVLKLLEDKRANRKSQSNISKALAKLNLIILPAKSCFWRWKINFYIATTLSLIGSLNFWNKNNVCPVYSLKINWDLVKIFTQIAHIWSNDLLEFLRKKDWETI